MDFSSFTNATHAAPLIEVKEGYVTIDGRTFFDPSLKSRKRVRAFIDNTGAPSENAVCFSERGNLLCLAGEMDLMGVEIRKPEWLDFWIPIHKLATWEVE